MKKPLKDYWFPWYPSRFKSKTMHLTTHQECLYRRLIDHYMETRQALPDNDLALARICGVSGADFFENSDVIRGFFQPKRGLLFNLTCERILKEQNGAHHARSQSASKAAKIKWEKHQQKQRELCATHPEAMRQNATEHKITEDKIIEDIKKELPIDTHTVSCETPNASGGVCVPQDNFSEALELYNAMAGANGLPKAQTLTPKRKTHLKKRLDEIGGLDGWRVALEKVAASDFLKGGSETGWRASLDFLLQQSSLTKLMEGTYDNRKSTKPAKLSPHDALAAGFDKATDMLNIFDENR